MTAAAAEFRNVDVAALVFSSSIAQTERRNHFDKASLKELADSIAEKGVVQPIVVRANGKPNVFEVVAGERRVMAAREAGLKQVPAMIRVLDDDQALEVQLIENLQREGLHELAEAEGYEALQKRGLTAEEIADKVGKSKGTVYARMKLLALSDVCRTAYYEGKINASIALIIARVPVHELQERALAKITQPNEWSKEPMTYRDALRYLQDEFTLKLSGAPFPREDATLCPSAGVCSACPKRTGNQPADLFGDFKSADICTDPICFREKRDAHQKRELEKARTTGQKVIGARQARAILPANSSYSWSNDGSHKHLRNGFARPSDKCLADPKKRTWAELAGKDAPTVLVQNPDSGRVFKAFEIEQIKELVEKKGVKIDKPPKDRTEEREQNREKEEAKRKLDEKVQAKLFAAIRAAASTKPSRDVLVALVARQLTFDAPEEIFAICGFEQPKRRLWGDAEEKKLAECVGALDDSEINQLAFASLYVNSIFDNYGDRKDLKATLARLKVDEKKIREQVEAEAAAAAPAEKKTAKKKGKK